MPHCRCAGAGLSQAQAAMDELQKAVKQAVGMVQGGALSPSQGLDSGKGHSRPAGKLRRPYSVLLTQPHLKVQPCSILCHICPANPPQAMHVCGAWSFQSHHVLRDTTPLGTPGALELPSQPFTVCVPFEMHSRLMSCICWPLSSSLLLICNARLLLMLGLWTQSLPR